MGRGEAGGFPNYIIVKVNRGVAQKSNLEDDSGHPSTPCQHNPLARPPSNHDGRIMTRPLPSQSGPALVTDLLLGSSRPPSLQSPLTTTLPPRWTDQQLDPILSIPSPFVSLVEGVP